MPSTAQHKPSTERADDEVVEVGVRTRHQPAAVPLSTISCHARRSGGRRWLMGVRRCTARTSSLTKMAAAAWGVLGRPIACAPPRDGPVLRDPGTRRATRRVAEARLAVIAELLPRWRRERAMHSGHLLEKLLGSTRGRAAAARALLEGVQAVDAASAEAATALQTKRRLAAMMQRRRTRMRRRARKDRSYEPCSTHSSRTCSAAGRMPALIISPSLRPSAVTH